MGRDKEKDDSNVKYIHTTKYGKVFIKTEDFFDQKKVKRMVRKLMNSDLVREMEASKGKDLTSA